MSDPKAKQKAEMTAMLQKILKKVDESPSKAARILSQWTNLKKQPEITPHKKDQATVRKRVA